MLPVERRGQAEGGILALGPAAAHGRGFYRGDSFRNSAPAAATPTPYVMSTLSSSEYWSLKLLLPKPPALYDAERPLAARMKAMTPPTISTFQTMVCGLT